MTLAVFLLCYLGIAFGRFPRLAIDRTGIALLGAVAMVLIGALTPEAALAAIHIPTLLLLYGLMIVSAQLRLGGFYTWLALKVTLWIDAPAHFLFALMLVSGLLASVLANDIICLAFTPVLGAALRRRNLNPLPFLLGLAMATNLGSAATLIGNPQSMLIAQVFELNFTAFLLWCTPPSLVALLVTYGVLYALFRKKWKDPLIREEFEEPEWPPLHRWQTLKGLLAVLAVLVLLLLNQPRALSVLTVAGVLLLSRRMHTRSMLERVDWHLITLFCGLFIVVRALYLTGLPLLAVEHLAVIGVDLQNPYMLSGVAVLLSNLVSNVPATLLLLEPLRDAPDSTAYVLSLSATYAGNLLTLGSLANLIVIEQAKLCGIHIRFRDYARVGIPVTLLTLLILFAWIALMV
ncbi:MAG: SLC13 family permease [Kiritimatiellia bacterium]